MTVSERMYEDVSEPTVSVPGVAVQQVVQRWVGERISWLKGRALDLSATPTALLYRAAVPPQRLLQAAHPRKLIRTLSNTGNRLRTRLTSLARLERAEAPTAPPPVATVDKMRTYWKARVDVLQKMLERKYTL